MIRNLCLTLILSALARRDILFCRCREFQHGLYGPPSALKRGNHWLRIRRQQIRRLGPARWYWRSLLDRSPRRECAVVRAHGRPGTESLK